MVFSPPEWVPKLPLEIPDSISVADFVLDEKYGRFPIAKSLDPYTCGISAKTYSAQEVKDRTVSLSKGLAKELGWKVGQGSEYDKVIGVFAFNTIDVMTLSWAVHRLDGISSPANVAYSADELSYQLKNSGATCLFTCVPLLPTALEAAAKVGIPKNRVYICPVPEAAAGGANSPKDHKTLDQLIEEGVSLPDLEPQKWEKGQGSKQTAFLCYSSGTSGLPKGVMISHRNVIANTLQICTYDQVGRDLVRKSYQDVALGLLPQSHIYSLVVICHCSTYRGDQVIILPKFDLSHYLSAITKFKINSLYVVPPIVIAMTKNKPVLDKYDLSSVKIVFTGAAPLGRETAEALVSQYPEWAVRQGYGLTETCTVVTSTSPHDICFGSCGSIISGVECKIVSSEGKEITEYDQPGELLVKSPSVVLGYLKNEKATEETFFEDEDGRWMRTGDEAVIRKSPNGHEHVWIVDRIKELIKVKGLQVAPAELEAVLLTHPAVADCAVIPVPDDRAGEIPKAFVVKSGQFGGIEDNDAIIKRDIQKHIEKQKARHKWLKGGVEFVDVIPKSPSGKILRRLLRDKEKERRRQSGAKL